MPRDRALEPLPPIGNLPRAVRLLAEATLGQAGATADHLLLLADACHEAALILPIGVSIAMRDLAHELRRRAPDYA